VNAVEQLLDSWKNGNGGVALIAGEAGQGKTFLLDTLAERLGEAAVRVECRAPIGSFNVASIQPLQPFGYALEQLYLAGGEAARKRLAVNVGMSLLSALPVVGDVIYAVKAVSQDLTEYRRETAAMQAKKQAAVDECIHALRVHAERQPTVLLVDDGHWSDAQSVDVLQRLMSGLQDTPLAIIWAVTPSLARQSNLALTSAMRDPDMASRTIHLAPFERSDLDALVARMEPSCKPTVAQLDILHERTAGNPGILREYLTWLRQAGHIADDGSIHAEALVHGGVHLGDHPATTMLVHEVGDDDATILSIAASEGREFTAWMMSQMLHTDVVTTIRTLRRLARQTGFIRSIGMRTRYGVRTTAYEFTQTFVWTYFQHVPEYEERRAIHHAMADVLMREQERTKLDEVRTQLAAFIAAHASEAEETDVADRMLEHSARSADQTGATAIAGLIRATMITSSEPLPEADMPSPHANPSGDAVGSAAPRSMTDVIRGICDDIVAGNIEAARNAVAAIISENTSTLTTSERVLLRCLGARAATERGAFAEATSLLDVAERDHHLTPRDRCLILNQRAVTDLHSGQAHRARTHLQEAGQLARSLSADVRLLTLGNVVLVLRATSDPDLERMSRLLRRSLQVASLPTLRADIGL
jgi:hypothetical protein